MQGAYRRKKWVPSLFSKSVECIIAHLPLYKGILIYLPVSAKERMLRKILLEGITWEDFTSNEILSNLIHPGLKSINFHSVRVDDDTLDIIKLCAGLTEIRLRNFGNLDVTSQDGELILAHLHPANRIAYPHRVPHFTIHMNMNSISQGVISINWQVIFHPVIVLKHFSGYSKFNLIRQRGVDLLMDGTIGTKDDTLKRLFEQTKELILLDIAHCKEFNDDVLKHMALCCPKARELCVEGCDLTDDGFLTLTKNNKDLKRITISKTNITGNGIQTAVSLKNCHFLQELRLDNCLDVNDDVLKAVIQYCPEIEILTFYNCAVNVQTSIFQDISVKCKNLKQLHWTITW